MTFLAGCVALGVGSAKEGSSAKFPRAQGYPTAAGPQSSGCALLAVTSGAFLADRALCVTLNLAEGKGEGPPRVLFWPQLMENCRIGE
jgi:hypothetical protein